MSSSAELLARVALLVEQVNEILSGAIPVGIIENRTSDPSSPATGQIWLRVDL